MTPEIVEYWCTQVMKVATTMNGVLILKKSPTEREFWLFLAKWLFEMLSSCTMAHSVPAVTKDHLSTALNSSLSISRHKYVAMRCAFKMTNAQIIHSMEHSTARVHELVEIHKLLVAGETVLETDGREALRIKKKIVSTSGKPQFKCLLIRGLTVKLEGSGLVVFVDGRYNYKKNKWSATRTALSLISSVEQRTNRQYLALLDGVYAVKEFIRLSARDIRSKCVISATTSNVVRGEYRNFAKMADAFVAEGTSSTIYSTTTKLCICLTKSNGKGFVLVSNATSPRDHHPPHPAPDLPEIVIPCTWDVAMSLALLANDDNGVIFNSRLIRPDMPEYSSRSIHLAIKRLTSHDITSPLDDNGELDLDKVRSLPDPALGLICESLGTELPQSSTRSDKIDSILQNHPLADKYRLQKYLDAFAPRDKKRKPANPVLLQQEYRRYVNTSEELVSDLIVAEEEPNFRQLYMANYGLQDRFNALLYMAFKWSCARDPMAKISWFVLATMVLNARSIFCEANHTHSTAAPAHVLAFFVKLIEQILQYLDIPCETTDELRLQVTQSEAQIQTLQDLVKHLKAHPPRDNKNQD